MEKFKNRKGARLKFKSRMSSVELRAEKAVWKNRVASDEECVTCCNWEEEDVQHVMMRCEVYRQGRWMMHQLELWDGLGMKESL